MRQGVETTVTARVSRTKTGITAGLPADEAGSVKVEEVKVGEVMTASLDHDPGDFLVVPLSTATQVVTGPFTQWQWRVTPLRSGERHLNLRLSARLQLPDGSREFKDIPVEEAVIIVHVNPVYLAQQFVASNWQWLIGGPVGLLALLGWLRKRGAPERQ
jgi:hypothetical protein